MKHGLAGNQATRQAYHTGNLSQSEVRNASANNNFYANIGVNAGYSTSKNSNNSHNESAVVTTMKQFKHNLQQCKQHNLSGDTGTRRNIYLQQCKKYSEGSSRTS